MIWLALHMWFLLLLAFLLGLLIGWWVWHRSRIETLATIDTTPVPSPAPAAFQAAAAPLETVASTDMKKPMLYENGPNDGPADDLKKIKGIGPKYEKLLNSLGIYYFRQIVSWNEAEIKWLDKRLEFPGRIGREDWQAQAATLRQGDSTEFATRYDKGETPSSYGGDKDGDEQD